MQQHLRFWSVIFVVALFLVILPFAGTLLAQQAPAPAAGTATAPAETPNPTPPPPGTGDATPPKTAPDTTPAPEPTKEAPPEKPQLKLFGRDLFQLPANIFDQPDAPVPPDYVLGSGDTLSVTCWQGSTEYERSNVVISPSGEIYLKLIGSIPVAQKSLAQVETELRQRYARYYKKFDFSLQVVGRRTMPVFVMGEVVKPGKYLVSSLATVFTALYAAGGPTDIGSLRRIRLLRGGVLVSEIDVYSYLLRGASADLPLKPGDTVYVPLAGSVVTVDGEVRRPARYELVEEETLSDTLELAGGTTAKNAGHLQLARVDADHKRRLQDLQLPADANFALKDGDELMIMPVLADLGNAFYLTGAVNRPGAYPIEKAATIGALLKLADGVTMDAYLEQAILDRPGDRATNYVHTQIPVRLRALLQGDASADVQLKPMDTLRVYDRNQLTDVMDRVQIVGEVVKPDSYPFGDGMRVADLIQRAFGLTSKAYMQQAHLYRFPIGEPPKMLTIDLAKALAGDKTANVELAARDRLVISSREEVQDQLVTIIGEVNTPGQLKYYDGMHISDAVFLAGGLKPDVALDRALLTRLDEKTYSEQLIEVSLRGVLAHDPAQDLKLQNNDRLTVYPVSQLGVRNTISVEGAVTEPGKFAYIGDMRVSHLLFLAKGLLPDAYAKRADLYRLRPDNSLEIIPIDLVAARNGALTDANPLLKPQDRLVISRISDMEEPHIVKIGGYVRKPGEYPLTVGMKLSDLLHLSGGLRPDADPVMHLSRQQNERVVSTDFPVTDQNGDVVLAVDPLLESNDLINVNGNAQYVRMTETVSIEGEVPHPGTYPAYSGSRQTPKTLYALITQSGGLLKESYPTGIILYRRLAALHTEEAQQELNKTMHDLDLGVGIITPDTPKTPGTSNPPPGGTQPAPDGTAPATEGTTPAGGTAPAGGTTPVETAKAADAAKSETIANISRSLSQVLTTDQGNTVVLVIPPRSMQEQEMNASIPVDADTIVRSQGRKGDIVLEPGDVVYIPKRPSTISIIGGVTTNGSVVYEDGKPLSYFLNKVGGISPDGDQSRIIVMRMNGLVLPLKQAKTIQPGDIVIVPTKHMVRLIHTKGPFERALQAISEVALSFLPFKK